MTISMNGKVALVSGASSGIGKATALLFAARGARVAAVARNEDRGKETVEEIIRAGGAAEFISADLECPDDVAAMVAETMARFGRLDFAFNNAGMVGDMAAVADQDIANWNRVIATDLTATFLAMKYEIAAMLQTGGVIVNNASGAGVMPQETLSPYCAAKHGVLGLTKTAAREYAAKGIRVNAVCPGLTETPQLLSTFEDNPNGLAALQRGLPAGHMGQPIDIANAVVWLCSEEARYVSGASFFVDGALACH